MRTLIIVALVASNVIACNVGCYEYQGNCACEQRPADSDASSIKPSDEKPPTDKMPSYQREGIVAAMPMSLAAQIIKEDEEKAKADAEGKKAAGIQ